MKKFIVFEELNETGKSTLLEKFKATNTDYLPMYSVPDELAEIRKRLIKHTTL
jgi:hypothetical protein